VIRLAQQGKKLVWAVWVWRKGGSNEHGQGLPLVARLRKRTQTSCQRLTSLIRGRRMSLKLLERCGTRFGFLRLASGCPGTRCA